MREADLVVTRSQHRRLARGHQPQPGPLGAERRFQGRTARLRERCRVADNLARIGRQGGEPLAQQRAQGLGQRDLSGQPIHAPGLERTSDLDGVERIAA